MVSTDFTAYKNFRAQINVTYNGGKMEKWKNKSELFLFQEIMESPNQFSDIMKSDPNSGI